MIGASVVAIVKYNDQQDFLLSQVIPQAFRPRQRTIASGVRALGMGALLLDTSEGGRMAPSAARHGEGV